jgi:hypothetical protein
MYIRSLLIWVRSVCHLSIEASRGAWFVSCVMIKYFVNCCEKEGIIIYSLILRATGWQNPIIKTITVVANQ